MGTITFTGGTNTQQTAITSAHSKLSTAVTSAATQAQAGGGNFVTCFGQSGTAPQATVAGVYTTVGQTLSTLNFAYDLSKWLITPYGHGLCLLFYNTSATDISVGMWQQFWDAYTMYPQAGSVTLQRSLFEQLALIDGNGMTYYGTAADPAEAAILAMADPTRALVNIRAYSLYLGTFLAG